MARNGIHGSSKKGMVVVVRETRILLQDGMYKRRQDKEGKVPSDELVIWAMAWCTTISQPNTWVKESSHPSIPGDWGTVQMVGCRIGRNGNKGVIRASALASSPNSLDKFR